MSDQYGWYEEQETQQQEDSPKGMRKQLQDLAAKLAERDAAIAELQQINRQRNVQDALSGLGLPNPDKIARLVPSDVADKPDALKAWVDDYREVFAPKASAGEAAPNEEAAPVSQGAPNIPLEQVESWQRMQTADASAGTLTPDLESTQIAALARARDAAIASGGGVDDFIAILRGEREI